MSLQPVKSQLEDTANLTSLYRCPYCPNSFENHMSLHLFKLHVKKVHRMSCMDSFTCPKCLQPVFESPVSEDVNKENPTSIKECEDQNIINQGMAIYQIVYYDQYRIKSLMKLLHSVYYKNFFN